MTWLVEFFKAKNLDRKFSRLGEGQRLNETAAPNQPTSNPVPQPRPSTEPPSSKAAEAAMERLSNRYKKPERPAFREVKRELEAQKSQMEEARQLQERLTQRVVKVDLPSALSRVLFWCPALLGNSLIGSRDEVDTGIRECLLAESTRNPAEVSALMLIRGLQAVKPPAASVDTPVNEQPTASEWREKQKQNFVRILENLSREPQNQSYRRLRVANQSVQRLLSIEGAEMFLTVCKFTKKSVPVSRPSPPSVAPSVLPADPLAAEEGTLPELEVLWMISEEDASCKEHLDAMRDLLLTAEPILPELYRDTKVFQATGNVSVSISRDQLPDEFFCHTKEDIRKILDQQQRTIAESGMLLTKAMRERLKLQEVRLFRYALIRIRLPGNLLLQGTFYASDKLSSIRCWVSGCLAEPSIEYQLWAPPGTFTLAKPNAPNTARTELTDNSATITELGLAPCSLLTLVVCDTAKTALESTSKNGGSLLRPDIYATITQL